MISKSVTHFEKIIKKKFVSVCCSYGGLPQWLNSKASACKAGDTGDVGLISGSGRSCGGGNGNPLQYSCLENPMDRRALWAAVHGVAKELDMTKQLSSNKYIKWSRGIMD